MRLIRGVVCGVVGDGWYMRRSVHWMTDADEDEAESGCRSRLIRRRCKRGLQSWSVLQLMVILEVKTVRHEMGSCSSV
jgi:hypothetical protein